MRRTISALVPVLLASLAGLVLVPAGHAAEGDSFSRVLDRGPGGERYVALGDSFTSGPGIAPQRAGGCMRSEKNFPSVFAGKLDAQTGGGLTAYTDASCGGAQTKDLRAPQVLGSFTNAPQLDALDADTTLVTFGTMGGNDIGLVQLAAGCFTADCVPAAGTDPLGPKFAALGAALDQGLADVRTRAPKADVLVIGYGTYLPPGGCPATFGGALTVEEFAYVQGQIDRMSDTLKAAADRNGVGFVDMRQVPGSVDRTVCAPPNRQWIRAINTYDDGIVLHPSACGMDAMAQHLHRTLQARRGLEQTAFDSSCVSAGPGAPVETPPVEPEPTDAEIRTELRAQAKKLDARTSCRAGKAVVKVRGGTRHVTRMKVTVRGKKVAMDRKAPLRAVLKPARVPARGKVRAEVVLRDRGVKVTRTLKVERPRCLR
ncbi:SGNH/GDSL hydrolase family protein [Nocardioides solisilvae]|uniref:SGNH/GDSL hydrolase family protein n=1 Tax=Nocardioides solisilvae TaxID=1542435 RepID=UPI000D7453CE|nr:SGNH/GDSL hydrolase family protein [Nocardioides solisilvae]